MLDVGWLAGLAGIAAAAVVILSAAANSVSWYRQRIKLKRIASADDPDFAEFAALHEKEFGGAVGDSCEDIADWIEADRRNPRQAVNEILVTATRGDSCLGYLYGQYYRDEKLVFISYYAIDRSIAAARKHAAEKLMAYLLKVLKKEKFDWTAILAELEEEKAISLMATFQRTSKRLAKRTRSVVQVYRLGVPYYQPLLRPDDVTARSSTFGKSHMRQWLMYIAKDPSDVHTIGRAAYITRRQAEGILTFLFMRLYADAFPDNVKYHRYLTNELKRATASLSSRVRVEDNWRLASSMSPLGH